MGNIAQIIYADKIAFFILGNPYYLIVIRNREVAEVHKKTLEAFEKHLVKNGKLDVDLLKIYKKMIIKAEELLSIFSKEKGKRGTFTYQKLPQANREPAKESFDNASFFFKTINKIVDK